jgi:flagellar hook assembly protein FlgD
MKYIFLVLLLCNLSYLLFASTFPANITSFDVRADVKKLNKLDISIEGVSHNVIQTWVTRDQFNLLQQQGYQVEELPDIAKEYASKLWEETKDTRDPMNAYYSYDEYVTVMQNIASQYPTICHLYTIGTSVQNRPIYMMKISANVDIEENEPEVKLDAGMHGNEVVGYDLLLRLIQLLATGHSEPRIANILNTTELWINPLFNPDGYVLMQRENANGVDLNRHFPDFITDPVNTTAGREPEIASYMNFAAQHCLNLALNYHTGSLVMNYPWDKIETRTPDNDLYIDISEAYSIHNTPMWNSTEFTHGISDGYDWYQVNGSNIDWIYYYYSCLSITCEVSSITWPDAATLPTFWSQNQESLLSYIEYAQQGIKGVVKNASNTPLAATLHIVGIDKDIVTDQDVGDYHRILKPGTYSITASSLGYISQTVTGVVVAAGTGTTVDFTLQQAQTLTFSGHVKDINGLAVASATIDLNTNGIGVAQTDANGAFAIQNVPEGTYIISVQQSGYTRINTVYAMNVQNQYPIVLVLQPAIFEEHFESGIGAWQVTGTWGLMLSGTNHVLADSPTSNYLDSQNTNAKLIQPINLQNVTSPIISFRVKYDLEPSYDYAYFEASSNGTAWTQIATYNGTQDWQSVSYSLSSFSGGNCYIRFHLHTDSSEHNYDGVFFDDIILNGNQANLVVWGDVNADGLITKSDAQAILDYSVDLDPLAAIDPRPWTDNRIDRADENNDGNVTSMDASLVLRYLKGTLNQMPSQSGALITYSDPIVSITNSISQLFLNVQNISNLYALNATLLPAIMDDEFVLNSSLIFNDIIISSNRLSNGLKLGYASIQMVPGAADVFATSIPLIDVQHPLTANLIVNETPQTIHYDTVPVTDPIALPKVTSLKQNFPNPFNPETNISFELAKYGSTELSIYNIRGEKIRTLLSQKMNAGSYCITWNGKDETGKSVASGMYLYRLITPDRHFIRKMLMLQ